jgi:hypothetical protein
MFYTYAHTKPDGTIFYIGKGQGRRAWDKHSRNRHWNFVVAKHGFEVVILGEFEEEQSALNEEVELIAHFRKFNTLVNITDGGDINPMYNPEVAARTAATKRAKGQYSGKEMAEYNASYKERMEDPEFAKKVSEDRTKAQKASIVALHAKMQDKVQLVRQLREEGKTYQQISDVVALSTTTVWNIIKGKTYACVA